MKLWAMSCRATQDGQVMMESSDKTRSTGEGNGNSLQYSCLENPMNSMKSQKDMTLYHWYHRNFWLVTQSHLVQLSATPCTAAHQASLSFTISWNLLKFMSIESMMLSMHPSHPLLLPSPPALNLSQSQSIF